LFNCQQVNIKYLCIGFNQSLPFTEKIMRSSLMLPLNMTVTDDEIKYICKYVRDFYND